MRKDQSEVVVHGFLRGVDGVYDDVAALVLEFYHSWLQIGDEIDARDGAGKWFSAIIMAQKLKGQPLIDAHSDGMNWLKSDIPDELEAVYVHYTEWDTKWDEWIVVDPSRSGTICRCPGPCQTSKDGPFTHRMALRNAQREIKRNKNVVDESVCGSLIIAGGVGLVNVDEMSLVNSVVQCMAYCPPLRQYFESGEWWRDFNTWNPLGTIVFEMAKLLRAIWSAEYQGIQVVVPRSFQGLLDKCTSKFGGWKQRDAMVFLEFILNNLHDELTSAQKRPTMDAIESKLRAAAEKSEDHSKAELNWYLMRNQQTHDVVIRGQSKIRELFHAQQRVRWACPDCRKGTLATKFGTYTHLSLPLVDDSQLSLVVDVFHLGITRENKESPNKPTRHVFHVNKFDMVRELRALIAQKYKTKTNLVRLYENEDMHVTRELDENLWRKMVEIHDSRHELAVACYILKDWSATEIKHSEISLALCKLSHYAPVTKKVFGLPFVFSFLKIDSTRKVHQTVYRQLHAWIGTTGNVLAAPPDSDDDARWDALLASNALPYRLCYSYRSSDYNKDPTQTRHIVVHNILCSDEAPWPNLFRYSVEWGDGAIHDDGAILRVEWSDSAFVALQSVMSKVVVDGEYSKWREQGKGAGDCLNLYDCLNAYVSKQLIDENDHSHCSECSTRHITKQIDLWSLPELLIIHLKRFGSDGVKKSSALVDCPIRGLDLTAHLINGGDQSKSSAFVYDLFAVSCHSDGSFGEGCHTSYALNTQTKQWLYFNGSAVQFAKQRDIISQATHILFYRKRN